MEKENGLKLITLKQSDFLRTLENAIQFGQPVLLQEVLEDLDPALEPIMSRAVVKVGNRSIIKLGDKEVDYNPEFRFYLTTKLSNPHYTPEISTKATICNFCVKQQGLEDQVRGIPSCVPSPSPSAPQTPHTQPCASLPPKARVYVCARSCLGSSCARSVPTSRRPRTS